MAAITREKKRQQKLSDYFAPSQKTDSTVATKSTTKRKPANTKKKKQKTLTLEQKPKEKSEKGKKQKASTLEQKPKEKQEKGKKQKKDKSLSRRKTKKHIIAEEAREDTASSETTNDRIKDEDDSDDEDENMIKLIKRTSRKKKRVIHDSDEEDEKKEEEEEEKKDKEDKEEDEEVLTVNRHSSQKKRRRLIHDSDEECDYEDYTKAKHSNSEKNRVDDESDEDIREDLQFLDSSDILNRRTRGRQTSQYSQALKKLKDKKSKLSQYDETKKGPIESFTTRVIEIKDSDEESEDESEDLDDIVLSTEDEDEYEDEFVVDDDIIDGVKTSGTSEKMELPPEFSKNRIKSFSSQLETYIEYLIELILNPVFSITSKARYAMAREIVLKRVQGYKDSMVTSDVWLPPFKKAVDKCVNWKQTSYISFDPYGFGLACEACRSNKPASIQITLSTDDPDDEKEVLYLGSECCRKGEMYHHFFHFEEHMYKKVKILVSKAKRETKKKGAEAIFDILLRKGDVGKLTNSVRKSFNDVVMVYNLKGQRSRYDDLSSSDDEG